MLYHKYIAALVLLKFILIVPCLSHAGCALPEEIYSWDKTKIYEYIKNETDIIGVGVAEENLKHNEDKEWKWKQTIVHIVFPDKYNGRTFLLDWQKQSKDESYILREEGSPAIGEWAHKQRAFFIYGTFWGEKIVVSECLSRAVGLINRVDFMKMWGEDVAKQLRSKK